MTAPGDYCVTADSQVGERSVSSRKISPVLRTTLGLTVWTGSGNYTYVTLVRTRLSELAARYGLRVPSELVNDEARLGHGQVPKNTMPPRSTVN